MKPTILAAALLAALAVPSLGTANIQKKHLSTVTHEPLNP